MESTPVLTLAGLLMWTLVLPCLLLVAQAQDPALDSESLANTTEGRHLLVATLLEKLYAPIIDSPNTDNVLDQQPASLEVEGSPEVGSTARDLCCKLEEESCNFRDMLLREVLQAEGLLDCSNGSHIVVFENEVKKDITTQEDIIDGDRRDLDPMSNIAASTTDLVNRTLVAMEMPMKMKLLMPMMTLLMMPIMMPMITPMIIPMTLPMIMLMMMTLAIEMLISMILPSMLTE